MNKEENIGIYLVEVEIDTSKFHIVDKLEEWEKEDGVYKCKVQQNLT